MLSVYTVCFFGHRHIDDFSLVEQKIEALIDKLLNEHEYQDICRRLFVGGYYYLSKPKTEKVKNSRKNNTTEIIKKSSEVIANLEGIKIIRAEEITQGGWKLKYVTLTNDYSIADLERLISTVLGQKAVMQRLNYDFEIAAQLIYS